MKHSPRPRKKANLSESIYQQLNMYVLAAGAAGVGMLALAQPAEAKIVYTASNVAIGYGGVQDYHLDLNHDGIADFSIFTTNRSYQCGDRSRKIFGLFEKAAAGNGAVTKGKLKLAAALSAGVLIGPTRRFFGGTRTMSYRRHGYGGGCVSNQQRGYWQDANPGYLGLTFKISGRTHYGWARLIVTRKFFEGFTAMLSGYAYETIPNKAIVAGKTKGPEDVNIEESNAIPTAPTPELATLGMLALGAPGLSVWRREEPATRTQQSN
jgi:hypothetical protein